MVIYDKTSDFELFDYAHVNDFYLVSDSLFDSPSDVGKSCYSRNSQAFTDKGCNKCGRWIFKKGLNPDKQLSGCCWSEFGHFEGKYGLDSDDQPFLNF